MSLVEAPKTALPISTFDIFLSRIERLQISRWVIASHTSRFHNSSTMRRRIGIRIVNSKLKPEDVVRICANLLEPQEVGTEKAGRGIIIANIVSDEEQESAYLDGHLDLKKSIRTRKKHGEGPEEFTITATALSQPLLEDDRWYDLASPRTSKKHTTAPSTPGTTATSSDAIPPPPSNLLSSLQLQPTPSAVSAPAPAGPDLTAPVISTVKKHLCLHLLLVAAACPYHSPNQQVQLQKPWPLFGERMKVGLVSDVKTEEGLAPKSKEEAKEATVRKDWIVNANAVNSHRKISTASSPFSSPSLLTPLSPTAARWKIFSFGHLHPRTNLMPN
ncbi:hypothetical protein BT69DRAFT_1345645 [Atractiella rhizophila]|nr:hypothetical protein BT69DRAFT_1345645 [Atractiella rhizophila]